MVKLQRVGAEFTYRGTSKTPYLERPGPLHFLKTQLSTKYAASLGLPSELSAALDMGRRAYAWFLIPTTGRMGAAFQEAQDCLVKG
jgi:hypothetical protein